MYHTGVSSSINQGKHSYAFKDNDFWRNISLEISSISTLDIRQCFENSKELSNGCDDKGKKTY